MKQTQSIQDISDEKLPNFTNIFVH